MDTLETMYLTGIVDMPPPTLVVCFWIGVIICLIFSYLIDKK